MEAGPEIIACASLNEPEMCDIEVFPFGLSESRCR